jgi:glycosyltransferase involved in cell wall biosynthesis
MRVGWAGTFDPTFSRNRNLLRWMRDQAVRTDITRFELWGSERMDVTGDGRLRLLIRALQYPILIGRLLFKPRPDIYLVSYPGWVDMPFVSLVGRLRRVPVVFDPFISLYDTVVEDRGLYRRGSIVGKLTRIVDRVSMRLADQLIADTESHLDYFRQAAGLLEGAGAVLPVGADDEVFFKYQGPVDEKLVAFYGTLVPLQGIATILEAAEALGSSGVRTVIVGAGQQGHKIEEALDSGAAGYLEWRSPVPLDALPSLVAPAAICLGIFGVSDKANRVVPHKVYEYLAMGKPVITRDGAAIRSMFEEGEILTVEPGDAQLLAVTIKGLLADPERRMRMSEAGHAAYMRRFHGSVLSAELHKILQRSIDSYRRSDDA